MNWILDIPLGVRLAGLAVVGALLGGMVNWAVYQLAWNRRAISPWSAADKKAPARRASDRIPIYGWFGLRREASLHGTGFWVRPMLVEVVTAVGLAALYWWEVEQTALIWPMTPPPTDLVMHVQFVVHALLLLLMLAGSLIDVDEKTIPDGITVLGTLAGLMVVAAFPWVLLPVVVEVNEQPVSDFLRITSPLGWPDGWGGFPQWSALGIGAACWWGWCFALMPRTWYGRHGWCRALGLSWARLRRDGGTYRCILLGVVGTLAIAGVWRLGGDRWEGLLTALVGMAAGGGIIWAVRIVGSAVLHREAMGFGDVTLMAMIGVFLGWQSCLMIFFLAPFAGLAIGLFTLALHRESEIPYGPFLCLAAAVVLLRWAGVWNWAEDLFSLGMIIPAIMAVGLVLMAGLLGLWRAVFG